jgi:ATP:corrinoid adenosyltransferase
VPCRPIAAPSQSDGLKALTKLRPKVNPYRMLTSGFYSAGIEKVADRVTETTEIKHYFSQGVTAQKDIKH